MADRLLSFSSKVSAETLDGLLSKIKAMAVRRALRSEGGDVLAAAELLGYKRESLYRIMKQLGIEPGTGR